MSLEVRFTEGRKFYILEAREGSDVLKGVFDIHYNPHSKTMEDPFNGLKRMDKRIRKLENKATTPEKLHSMMKKVLTWAMQFESDGDPVTYFNLGIGSSDDFVEKMYAVDIKVFEDMVQDSPLADKNNIYVVPMESLDVLSSMKSGSGV